MRQGAGRVATASENYLTIPQVAAKLGVTRSTVYRYIAEGVPFLRVDIGLPGKPRVRVVESSVDQWIASRNQAVAS
jgi:excisionase family DNA binding protein